MSDKTSGTARLNAQNTSEDLLVVNDLRTAFSTPRGLVKAVDGVSLRLKRGHTLGVVGESGSGKTVLSRSIMRLSTGTNVHSTGEVIYDGTDLMSLSMREMRKLWGLDVAMVFQDPMTSLNPVVKVGRQVTEHLRFHLDISKSEAADTAVELLRSVRIPEPEARFDAYPHELSGGMRQRVSIAIALACGPKLLFADEPTTALDVTVQHQILNLLRQQQVDRFMSMILVTHDLGVVAGRADEIMVMYAGRPVETAPTKELFANLKHPYTEGLLNSIPKIVNPKHTRLQAIAGRPPDLINPPSGCAFSPRCPYAQQQCFEEAPPLVAAETPGHQFACFFPVGTPESEAAFQANLDAGVPVTLAAAGRTLATEELTV